VFEIKVKKSFSAAHFYVGVGGPERSPHGHDFRVTAVFTTESTNELGMIAHDKDMLKLLGKVIAPLDHEMLNDLSFFYSPTLESIATLILVSLRAVVPPQLKSST
jgi:6-pyruvoyl-tetrahydropterin synthase